MGEDDVLGALGRVRVVKGGEVSPLLMVVVMAALIAFPNLTRRMLAEVLQPMLHDKVRNAGGGGEF